MRSLEELKRDLKKVFINSGQNFEALRKSIGNEISFSEYESLDGEWDEDKTDLLIQEWQNQENKTGFTKSDLKTGMLVQYRDGGVRMVVNDVLLKYDLFMRVSNYKEDLLCKDDESFDIMKVSKVLSNQNLIPQNWTEKVLNKNLLWQRFEREEIEIDGVRYDKEEVKERLKELKPL